MKTTRVYIDGFNFYFGSVKETPFKWLNLVEAVRRHLNADHDIIGAKYFTAKVDVRPHDPDQPLRQEAYLRAL